MSRKTFGFLSIILLLAVSNSVFGFCYWRDTAGDAGGHLWNNPGNWYNKGTYYLPGIDDNAIVKRVWNADVVPPVLLYEPNAPIINSTMTGEWPVRVGSVSVYDDLEMKVNGGVLIIGGGTPSRYVDGRLYIGALKFEYPTPAAIDTLTMTAGSISTKEDLWVGSWGDETAIVNMTGGAINVGGHLRIGSSTVAEQDPEFNRQLVATANGSFYLHSGSVYAKTMTIFNNGSYSGNMDIEAGMLTVDGDIRANVSTWVSQGRLKAYNGAQTIVSSYKDGKTRVVASGNSAFLNRAFGPTPAEGILANYETAQVSWLLPSPRVAGNTIRCDVYMGSDPTMASATKIVNNSAVSSVAVALFGQTTYYWRVDCYDPNGGPAGGPQEVKTTGFVWTFTTSEAPPAYASNMSPASSAVGVPLNSILKWTAGFRAQKHDVYFGTNSNPGAAEHIGLRTAPYYSPGGLAADWDNVSLFADMWLDGGCISSNRFCDGADINMDGIVDFIDFSLTGVNLFETAAIVLQYDTTYYWKVNECDSSGNVTPGGAGQVMSFTTLSQKPGMVYPVNGSKADVEDDLVWTASPGGTYTYDVYFGKTNPPLFAGSQTTLGFDTGFMDFGATYYWRINAREGATNIIGDVWSFYTSTTRPAFPGAEGPGKWATGGRGGAVYRVTSLDSTTTAGTLKYGVETLTGPKIVVFAVGGYVDLKGGYLNVNGTHDDVTIAGQTAPGEGISLIHGSLNVEGQSGGALATNIIISNVRVRMGAGGGNQKDAAASRYSNNVIFDRISACWSTDEDFSATHIYDNTIQRCFITESLMEMGQEYPHAYASLVWGEFGAKMAYHHNLFAHHLTRMPAPGAISKAAEDPAGWTFGWRNNVIYNWRDAEPGYNVQEGANDGYTRLNFVGNYYKHGPERTVGTKIFAEYNKHTTGYFYGNSLDDYTPTDQYSLISFQGYTAEEKEAFKNKNASPMEYITTTDAATAYTDVLEESGTIIPSRDPVDLRIANDVKNGTGKIIDYDSEVGGDPVLYSLPVPTDTDTDGMPDYWESQYGSLTNNADDDSDRYTNIEEYINNTNPLVANSSSGAVVYVTALVSRFEESGGDPGEFVIWRNGDRSVPLTVNYTMSGTAINGIDYEGLSGSVVIPAGAKKVKLLIKPIDDGQADDGEQVIVTLNASANYKIGLPRQVLAVMSDDYGKKMASWYKLDESTGSTATDSSGLGHNGTLYETTPGAGLSWQPAGGQLGGALKFDGDGPAGGTNPNPRVQIPTTGMSAGGGTVAFWMNLTNPRPDNAGSRNNLVYFFGLKDTAANDRVNLYISSPAALKYEIGSASGTGSTLTRGIWYHMAVTWDGGGYKVYINGNPTYSGAYTGFTALPAVAQIGNKGVSAYTGSMHGLLDDVRIHARALTDTEVVEAMNGVSPFDVMPTPVAWWKFDETSGTVAADASGNGNNGDVRNGVTMGVSGAWGTAFSFDGDNDEVFVPDSASIEFQDTAFTAAFWMKSSMPSGDLSTVPYEPRILCKGSDNQLDSSEPPQDPGTGKRYQFYLNRRYKLFRFCIDDNTDPIWGKSQAETAWEKVINGDWVHIAGVRDTTADELRMYVDGLLTATAVDQSGSIDSGSENLIIANGPWTGVIGTPGNPSTSTYGFGFAGVLDDVKMFNKALSDDNVGRLPSRGLAAWRPSPVNGAKSIGTSVVLSWTAGDGATTNDVYFGTALIPDVNEFKGTQTAASYNPGTLSPTGTYYWRIDERSPAGVTRGYRWMFRAGSGPCDMMIPCDEASLRAALEVVGGCSEGGTITFDCSFSTIYISDRIYFNGSNMTLDGEDKKITLRYNGPDLCDQTEGQDHFMALGGSNNTIRNFKLLYFPNGITVTGGSDNIIENLSFPTICESAVINSANKAAGVGTIVRDCLFTGAEGRAVQIGDAVGGSCTVENCQFVNCAKPVSMTSGQNGLYVIRHCLMETNSGSPGYSHGMLGPICKPEVAGGIPNVLFESNVIVNPIDGLGIGGGAATVRAVVRNNVLKNTPAQGVTVKGLVFADDKGSIKLYNNEITDSKADGIRVSTGGSADLGGGSLGWTMTLTGYAADSASSPGHNLIQNNKVYNVNNATALTYSATGNCWDNSPPVSGDDYSGLWTVTPYNCTGAGTDGTAGLTGAVGPD